MALLLQLKQKLAHGFSGFWARWPRKHARKDANKAWDRLNPNHELEAEIHAALDWQIPMFEQRDPQYIPLAATWIRGERWTDEQPTTTPNRPIAKAVVPMAAQQMDASARIKSLIAAGLDPEEAKRQVYLEMGWIKG